MLTLTSVLDRTLRQHATRPAIVDDECNFSWQEFADRVARAAAALRRLGIRPGERFGILSANSFRYTELLYAGYWSGTIPVPINFRLAPPEIRYILNDANCKHLAIEDQFCALLNTKEISPWRDKAIHLTRPGDELKSPSYEELIAASEAMDPHPPHEDDDALLLYTGGTTGRSKGVRLSHRNIVANGMQVAMQMKATEHDVFMHIAPMFHAADLLGTAFVITGAGHSYLPTFSPNGVLAAIERSGTSTTMMAPTMIIMALTDGDVAAHNLSRFRLLFYGSSPMAAEWVQRTIEQFPETEIQQGYGLTETSPILTTLDPEVHRRAVADGNTNILRAAGRAVPGVDIQILDDDGNNVPLGEVGEVVVRGPNIAKGYLNRPEETAQAFRDGWFHTGDVGRIDDDGFIFLMDRKKDMVVTGGENVYTSEVEAVLYQHPGVHEAAVVGIPDPKFGEALFAVIVPAPGMALDQNSIMQHCEGKIGRYKIPRKMEFVEEMPKSAMGKILKAELRRIYSETAEE